MTLLICNTSCEQNCGLNATLARVVTLKKNTLKTSYQKQNSLTRYQLMHIIEYLYLTNIHFHGQHKTYKYTRQNLQDKIIIGNSNALIAELQTVLVPEAPIHFKLQRCHYLSMSYTNDTTYRAALKARLNLITTIPVILKHQMSMSLVQKAL